MVEITNTITNEITNLVNVFVKEGSSIAINKDIWDYAGIVGTAVAPITAIVFSIWNNLQINKIRREDLAREDELREKSELKDHYLTIDKFIDDQLYFLNKMTDQEFINIFVKLQSLISKCGMISRDKTRDQMVYYISTYIEVSYFLQTDIHTDQESTIIEMRAFFLNSIKEFDIFLINKDSKGLQLRIQELIDELKLVCTVKK
jgi:hypothetical protein